VTSSTVPTCCDECGQEFDYLDLVRRPASARWSPRRAELCPRCAELVRRRVLVQQVGLLVVVGILVILIMDLVAVVVGF